MLRHDLTAGLFAPVELILIEEDEDHSSLTYVRPSSLMVVEPNEPLLAAALELDAKLQALAAKVTADADTVHRSQSSFQIARRQPSMRLMFGDVGRGYP
jgi:hypothetical protein